MNPNSILAEDGFALADEGDCCVEIEDEGPPAGRWQANLPTASRVKVPTGAHR